LQTSALATSPPVLILLPDVSLPAKAHVRHFKNNLTHNKNPTSLTERVGHLRFVCLEDVESIAQYTPAYCHSYSSGTNMSGWILALASKFASWHLQKQDNDPCLLHRRYP
jgi:hypothetical protein